MKRILRIFNRPIVGGPILNAAYLSKHLTPEFETILVVGQMESHETAASRLLDSLGITIYTMKSLGRSLDPVRDWQSLREMRRLIRDFKPDIIHSHGAKPGVIGRLAGYLEKVPVRVHTYHGHVFHSYFGWFKTCFFLAIERNMARLSDAIIAVSPEQEEELTQIYRIAPREKFRVVSLGLDLDRFQAATAAMREDFRSFYNLSEKEVAIVITGRLVGVKNHSLFLRSLARAKQLTEVSLIGIIVGDGELRKSLEQEALALGFTFSGADSRGPDQDLVFTSWRSDIDRINAGADIAALSSLNEGTPVSLIEASATALPVISTNVGGVSHVVIDGKTGFLTQTGDSDSFAKRLVQLAENPDLRKQFGEAGARHVLSKFRYQRLITDMATLYNELLQKKKFRA